MPFKPVLLWTDAALFLMLACVVAYAVRVARSANLRAVWAQVARSAPAMCSATVLLASHYAGMIAVAALVAIVLVCLLITHAVLVLSERVDGFLGETGRSILTRLLGLILAALAVQFVADGIKELIRA